MFRIMTFALVTGTAALLPTAASADGLEAAQQEYYNARYESAARLTLVLCGDDVNGLAACELRTAALLFQIKAALGPQENRDVAWKDCAACVDLLSAFKVALARGQTLARARILTHILTMTRSGECSRYVTRPGRRRTSSREQKPALHSGTSRSANATSQGHSPPRTS